MDVQVGAEHYSFEAYDNRWRWLSYWHQIRAALRAEPRSVLEVGGGTGAFRAYLREQGIEVRSVDIDETRKPDYVADVTRLEETLPKDAHFDLIAACQVLEHLPFESFEPALAGIAGRCRHALITLPYRGWRFSMRVAAGDLDIAFGGRIPKPWPYRFNGQHYWELGWRYSARKVTRIIEQHFEVVDRYTIRENPYHYLWLLRSKRALPG